MEADSISFSHGDRRGFGRDLTAEKRPAHLYVAISTQPPVD